MDGQVVRQDSELSELLDQFECLRIVKMNGVDLNLFQFDYDQTWAVVFLRPDGTVLARYGTRASKDGMEYNSLENFELVAKRVLGTNQLWSSDDIAEHKKYYAKKRGPKLEHATAEQIPSELIRKIAAREKKGEESCIHCHNVYDARRDFAISLDKYDPKKRFKYPLPSNLGFMVDAGTSVLGVVADSPADKAGLKHGQHVHRIDGQAIHSLADIQFALHHVDGDEVEIVTEEFPPLASGDSKPVTRTLKLPAGWRKSDISWRASMYGMPPKPGLWIQALTKAEKVNRGIGEQELGLKVRGVFGKDVRNAGLKKGDVIIQFGEDQEHHSEGEFHAKLRLNYYQPNSKLPLKLYRGEKLLDLTVTFPNAKPSP